MKHLWASVVQAWAAFFSITFKVFKMDIDIRLQTMNIMDYQASAMSCGSVVRM